MLSQSRLGETTVDDPRHEKARVVRAIDRCQNCGDGIRWARPQKPCECTGQTVLIRAGYSRTRRETSTTTSAMGAVEITKTRAKAKTASTPSVMRGRAQTQAEMPRDQFGWLIGRCRQSLRCMRRTKPGHIMRLHGGMVARDSARDLHHHTTKTRTRKRRTSMATPSGARCCELEGRMRVGPRPLTSCEMGRS